MWNWKRPQQSCWASSFPLLSFDIHDAMLAFPKSKGGKKPACHSFKKANLCLSQGHKDVLSWTSFSLEVLQLWLLIEATVCCHEPLCPWRTGRWPASVLGFPGNPPHGRGRNEGHLLLFSTLMAFWNLAWHNVLQPSSLLVSQYCVTEVANLLVSLLSVQKNQAKKKESISTLKNQENLIMSLTRFFPWEV